MSERERTRAGMLVQRSDTAYRQTRRKTSRRVLLPLLDGALRQRHGHARLQYTESNRRLQRHESSGHGMESKRGGYWLQPHWNSRTWHDATTTTMTPIGFPLARYSHHAPREGRSLSTAARTGSTPARASTRCYPSRGLLHEIVSREGSHTRLSLERAQARLSLAEVVSTAVPKELARLLVHVRRHHKGHAVRDWRTKVYPHINALGTFGNLSSLELILFRRTV
jgi:hypothetical protein